MKKGIHNLVGCQCPKGSDIRFCLREEAPELEETKEPKEGWHNKYCSFCGKKIGKITHYGGKKKLKKCKWCQEGLSVCMDCYED